MGIKETFEFSVKILTGPPAQWRWKQEDTALAILCSLVEQLTDREAAAEHNRIFCENIKNQKSNEIKNTRFHKRSLERQLHHKYLNYKQKHCSFFVLLGRRECSEGKSICNCIASLQLCSEKCSGVKSTLPSEIISIKCSSTLCAQLLSTSWHIHKHVHFYHNSTESFFHGSQCPCGPTVCGINQQHPPAWTLARARALLRSQGINSDKSIVHTLQGCRDPKHRGVMMMTWLAFRVCIPQSHTQTHKVWTN